MGHEPSFLFKNCHDFILTQVGLVSCVVIVDLRMSMGRFAFS